VHKVGGSSVVSDALVSVSGSVLVTLVILNVAAQSAALEMCLIKGLSAGCKASVTWLFGVCVCLPRVHGFKWGRLPTFCFTFTHALTADKPTEQLKQYSRTASVKSKKLFW